MEVVFDVNIVAFVVFVSTFGVTDVASAVSAVEIVVFIVLYDVIAAAFGVLFVEFGVFYCSGLHWSKICCI